MHGYIFLKQKNVIIIAPLAYSSVPLCQYKKRYRNNTPLRGITT